MSWQRYHHRVRTSPRILAAVSVCLATIVVTGASASASTSVTLTTSHQAQGFAQTNLLQITTSAPLPASALPTITVKPPLTTKWVRIGSATFDLLDTGALAVDAHYRATVPVALSCASTCTSSRTRSVTLGTASSYLFADEVLATLRYLPLSFTPQSSRALTSFAAGTFQWRYTTLPGALTSEWNIGTDNVLLRCAIMSFQSQNHLTSSGLLDSTTMRALAAAQVANAFDKLPYNNVYVSKTRPQRLYLFSNGVMTYSELINTGIPGSDTTDGTHPVYLRLATQTMRGTNPDGSKYSDWVPWISYFQGGEALHGFLRPGYGYPQSLGCIEQTYANAKILWPQTPIGTPITIVE